MQRHTWTDFYEGLAGALLPYRDDREGLIAKLQALYEGVGMRLPKLDSTAVPADIDPYTVYGLFNKGISEANRKRVVAATAETFGIEAEQPRDFDGIPVLNNLNATFYAFVGDDRRGEHDIDNLWRVFEAQLALAAEDSAENRRTFVEAFDATAAQFGLGWKLTMGLYWARPFAFVNLDSRNRWFVGDAAKAGAAIAGIAPRERDAPIRDGGRYLAICDAVKSGLGSGDCPYADLPSLSSAAFVESERVNEEKRAAATGRPVLRSKYIPIMQGLIKALRDNAGELSPQGAREALVAGGGFDAATLDQGNSMGWARNYLAEGGHVDRGDEAKRLGVWRLTEAGWSVEMTDEEASRIIRSKNARTGEGQGEGDSLGDADCPAHRSRKTASDLR